MKIGDLAKRTSVSRDTIRFYEGKGMLTNVTRPFEWNNYKDYGEENVKRIQIIKYLQRFSFTLKECKELLDQKDASTDGCINKSAAFQIKLVIIEKQIIELQKTRDALIEIMNK
ncbi:MerR family transcriptional regulator [uncultured Aquimarina sp.]|uniref:MerR family transcriptional regulator n=1 Tax=uncultured Aquimarina sp. TaxID=575652 RepID=UPI0026396101|nr:MerR family transcriptional regulator [uncultured Aquimarina sp.]